ncbi:helix-turn-helix domain-containing protein [Streptomyces sp. NBC_01264]|uniref:helix-turn-helix domain-containing protein n=1 Tax=Streptomyces sp. NBC_01264 TaxID=2903804 RepID=UPI002254F9BC|nr:helix-turn-helix transcriptional regulator [Streptomyces sp. NBC_01264]MCX4780093.1 helix-turn-helix transcriptional regulator [Streptomyces sp. NBC_01264]
MAQAQVLPIADVPRAFGARLRAARQEAELSQDGLARAMAACGFNWRQTTVAKTEAADRPVLFAEVVALSRILETGIDEFLSETTPLDSLLAGIQRSALERGKDVHNAEQALQIARWNLHNVEAGLRLTQAIYAYRRDSDSGPLRADIELILEQYGEAVIRAYAVYEAARIPIPRVVDAEAKALQEAARGELARFNRLSESDMESESGEWLLAVASAAEGNKPVAAIRDQLSLENGYRVHLAELLTDLVVEYVHA